MDRAYPVGRIVWARPRKPKKDIFWPAKVVETINSKSKKKVIASVQFLGEDTYEDVKDANDLRDWDCPDQDQLISKAATLKKAEEKICFNKGVALAKRAMTKQLLLAISPRRSPRQIVQASTLSSASVFTSKQSPANPLGESPLSSPTKKRTAPEQSTDILFCDEHHMKVTISDSPQKLTPKSGKVKTSKKPQESSNVSVNFSPSKQNGHSSHEKTLNGENNRKDEGSCSLDKKRKIIKKGPDSEDRSKKKRKSGRKHLSMETLSTEDSKPDTLMTNTCSRESSLPGEKTQNISKNTNTTVLCSSNGELDKADADHTQSSSNGTDTTNSSVAVPVSWEGEESSDEELMEELLASPYKVQLQLNDVVWAKCGREPYWPAQVKRIQASKKKIKKHYVKFIGYLNRTYIAVRRLEPFSTEKRALFMDEARKFNCQQFEEAFIMAEDLVRRKALGISMEDDTEDYELMDSEEFKDEYTIVTEAKSKVKEQPARRSTRERRPARCTRSQYSSDILPHIRQTKTFLKEIFEEKKESQRHSIFRRGTQKEIGNLKRQSGFGPVKDPDVCNEVMEILRDFYRDLVRTDDDFSETAYIYDVWLPEAMIMAIQFRDRVDRKRAEGIYRGDR